MRKLICMLLVLALLLISAAPAEDIPDLQEDIPEIEEFPEEDEIEEAPADRELDLHDVQAVLQDTTSASAMLVDAYDLTLGVKERFMIPVTFIDGKEHPVIFRTKNSSIARVDQSGVITAVKKGKTWIRVESDGGVYDFKVTVKAAPSRVKITKSLVLGCGEERTLTATLPSGSAGAVTWLEEDPSVVQIGSEGTVHALRTGTARVKAVTYNGKSALCTVTVRPAPEVLTLDTSRTLGVGQTAALKAVLNEGTAGAIEWFTSDPQVVTVSSIGKLKAVGTGSAIVTAAAYNGVYADCMVTVKSAPVSIAMKTPLVTIGIGETIQVPVSFDPDCEPGLTYSSSSKRIAAVSADGTLRGVRKGTAVITAKTYNGKKAKLKVRVIKGSTALKLMDESVTIGEGLSCALRYVLPSGLTEAPVFESTSPEIASVSPEGIVTANSVGTASISAVDALGHTAYCTVIVCPAPETVMLSAYELTLGAGTKAELRAETSVGDCVFESDNAAVASVSASGTITAVAPGTCLITASAYNGVKRACIVTVLPAPVSVAFERNSVTIAAGDTCPLPALVYSPMDAMTGETSFVSSAPTIAAVSADGLVTAKKAGTAVISVKTYNGKIAKLNVTVVPAAKALRLNQSSVTLLPGEVFVPVVKYDNGLTAQCTFVSSNDAVAAVGPDGASVLAVGFGSAEVTVTDMRGLSAVLKVLVYASPESMYVSPASADLYIGDELRLDPVFAEGAYAAVSYKSSDKSVASVSADGVVKAVGAGSCTITVTAANGVSAQAKIYVGRAIVDLSKWNDITDFDKLAANVSFVILRASNNLTKDVKFDEYAAALKKRGVPFGVYCYGKAASVSEAKQEADFLYKTASPYEPYFYVYDAEEAGLTKSVIAAFLVQMRTKSGVKKVGCYCAHNRYEAYDFDSIRDDFDFVWIPRYGKNGGTVETSTPPAYKCDLWQYTSRGTIPGVTGNVDRNLITGSGRSVTWFTTR